MEKGEITRTSLDILQRRFYIWFNYKCLGRQIFFNIAELTNAIVEEIKKSIRDRIIYDVP
jgi:hypothetical protein